MATPVIYRKLQAIGFSRKYIKDVGALPAWWDDELWADPASRPIGLANLSRHLGVDIDSLLDPDASPRLKEFGICKYKKRASTADSELALARAIATRAAQLAAAAMDAPYIPVPSAADIRESILQQTGWVSLEALVDFCWASGIPVLQVDEFPVAAKKRPVALTFRADDRPAIVLCSTKNHPAWHLFPLAHELGHIFHGHIPLGGSLVDESSEDNVNDQEEQQADSFAAELLAGSWKPAPGFGRWPNAGELAKRALESASVRRIDPGHMVLRLAHVRPGNFWLVASAALKSLGYEVSGPDLIRSKLASHIDWEKLPEASSEFLARIAGRGVPV